jgi:hypothetical protein
MKYKLYRGLTLKSKEISAVSIMGIIYSISMFFYYFLLFIEAEVTNYK